MQDHSTIKIFLNNASMLYFSISNRIAYKIANANLGWLTQSYSGLFSYWTATFLTWFSKRRP